MDKLNFNFFEHLEKRVDKLITEKDIIDFENKYDFKLPKEYKDFLLSYNGGYLPYSIKLDENYYDLENVYSNNTEVNRFYSLQETTGLLESDHVYCEDGIFSQNFIPNKLSPFATDHVGYYIFYIGVGENNLGKIYSYDHQGDLCEPGEELKYLCESFTDFVNGFQIIKD